MKPKSCECVTEPAPFLVFEKTKPSIEEKAKLYWKRLKEIEPHAPAIQPPPSAESAKTSQYQELPEEACTEEEDEFAEEDAHAPSKDNCLRELFEKMLKLRMDEHALAIADGYRTRPEVCLCRDECCTCFDYSQFLHNLKLHDRKDLLLRVYAKTNQRKRNKLAAETTSDIKTIRSAEKLDSREDVNDEFALKTESDHDSVDGVATSVITQIRSKVRPGLERKTPPRRKLPNEGSKKVTRPVLSKVNRGPPYETKFNSVHRRVREFDPDSYKILVREEIKQLNDVPVSERKLAENRVSNLAERPPWKI